MPRQATEERLTTETKIRATVTIDGAGKAQVKTGIPFMDHMLTLAAKHGYFDLEIDASGDLEIDAHHTMEDLGIVLGTALRKALGDKRGIRRYGCFMLPMDESLVHIAIDLSGRPNLSYNVTTPTDHINGVPVRLFREFFQALVNSLGFALHVDLVRGDESHHILEAVFKGFAKALDQATALEARENSIPSTKGSL